MIVYNCNPLNIDTVHTKKCVDGAFIYGEIFMKKKDSTFLYFGIFITIIIPIILLLFSPSLPDIMLAIGSIAALDGLCFLAHKTLNK